nr:helix-turn-helix domain-containing protein [Saccharopolyspora spinosa]
MDRQTYTVDDVAGVLGVSRGVAYEQVRERAIPLMRLAKRWIIPKARFDAWLAGKGARWDSSTPPRAASGARTGEIRRASNLRRRSAPSARPTPTSPRLRRRRRKASYVSPHAGRVLFGKHAQRWTDTWSTGGGGPHPEEAQARHP